MPIVLDINQNQQKTNCVIGNIVANFLQHSGHLEELTSSKVTDFMFEVASSII